MASNNEEFTQYHIFLENIVKSNNTQSSTEAPLKTAQMRNRISSVDAEGEVIYWILKYLDENKCPTKLIAPIVRNILVEIQSDPDYQHPSDLRLLASNVFHGFCGRLLNNVELNNIIDKAKSPELNDDLLSIPIRTAGSAINGRRKMEDRTICIDEFHKVYDVTNPAKTTSFYGVFDGHAGYIAAHYAACQLPYIFSLTSNQTTDPVTLFQRAFEKTDSNFNLKGATSGGTTAVCTLYQPEDKCLIIAWAGDSQAMLTKQHGQIMQLVTPHRPDLEREKHRIQSSGGSITTVSGVERVKGTLNVTRSLGDIRMKKYVVSHPDCVVVDLDGNEEFLVMATDGLWDHAHETEIARTVYDCIKEDCENLDLIPSRLIKLAQDGQSSDNISVVVIFFKHPSQIAKNCDNLTIMESEFDNIKEVEYYDYSRNFYPSDENSTSNSHAVDPKQMRWTPNDNLNNIISDEVSQTTTTTTTTSTTTNNGQFDDNLLNSSDNIDLNQKLSPLVGSGDDNSLHHASTLENNGEEFLATGGYDNKNRELLTPTTTQFDDNDDDHNKHQKILLEKNQPHHPQQLVDTDGDYGPETCVDVTDDVVMMTENSADTNNLSEQSTLSHSKDTLPSSDNCNPFDNKNAMDMEETNEYQLGHAGADAHLQLDDANKATPLLSPEVEELPLSSDGQMHFTNEGYQQSPLEDEIPVGIGSQHQFEDEFMQSNGHLSPIEVKDNEVEKEQKDHKEEHQEEIDSLAKLERFGDPEESDVQNMSNLKPELVENFFGNPIDCEGVIKDKEIISNNLDNDDENDFRLKDEEEILEKHVVESEFAVKESEALDLSQKDHLQQPLHNLEDDILEEKPILTGHYVEEEIHFDESPMKLEAAEEDEKLSEFADEKQDKEEFSEKEDKVEEKLVFVEQKSAPSEDIELEEDDCIHLEEDVHPSDYLAMLEKQKEEQHQQLGQVDEGFEKEGQFEEDEPKIHSDNEEEQQQQKPLIEEDNKVIDKVMEKEEALPQQLHFSIDNELGSNGIDKEQHQADEKLDEQVEEIDRNEHYDMDESISAGTEQQEKERHLDDIEIMSQQFDRFEKEDGLKSDQQLDNESVTEMVQNDQRYESEEFEKIEELQKQLQQPEESPIHEEILENNKLESEVASLIEEHISLIEDSIVQPEKQCFEEPEKIPEMQEIVDLVNQLEHSMGIAEDLTAAGEELENKFLDDQLFEETKKEVDGCATLEELENKFVESNEKQLQNIVAFEEELETNMLHEHEKTIEQLEEQFVERVGNHLQDSATLEELGNNLLECNEKILDEPTYEELEKQFVESNEKQMLDIAAFEEELGRKSLEEAEKQFAKCTEEQLQKVEQEVLDSKPVSDERPEKAIQPFEEPDIDPENLVEVEEPIIVKEQVVIKPSALPVSAQEPSAVPPTQESCDESEDDEWKYKKEGQGEKQLGVQGDTVVEEELLPQQPHEASETFSIHERKASGNILQQQISINTSNLIESINDTFEGLTQNLTELAEQAAAAATVCEDKKIEQGLQNLNLSQSSTREKLDNIEDANDDDEDLSASEMNSRLNPEAKEFVPTMSPPAASPKDLANGFDGQAPKAIPQHFKDEVISSSPRKGRESNMEDINIPAENEFEEEIAHKPHGLPDDEAIVEPTENGNGLFQELNWKEAMHGSEKEEGPLVDSPLTEESLEVVDNVKQFGGVQEFSAPVDLDNAGMKQSIYIESNTSNDELNTVQMLPEEEMESGNSSFEIKNKEENDVVSQEGVQEILTLASDDKIETKAEAEIEQKMEQLLLSHDKELTKDIQMETEQVPINGIEMAPEEPVKEQLVAVAEPVIEQAHEAVEAAVESVSTPVPAAEEPSNEGLALGAAVAVVAAATTATTAAVKKVEAEKNQKNLKKTSSATKSKVPDTKKPAVGTAAKTSTASSLAAKRTSTDKPKPAAASSLAAKKTVSSTVSAAPRPRLATTAATAGGAKTPTEKKTTTSTTSTVKSRIDAKPPTSLATRKPLTSSAPKTTASKPGDETKSSSSTVKSSTVGKTSLGAKPSIGSARTSSTTNSISKPRPATAPSTATTNGIASKTAAAPKPSTLAPKSAGTTKSSITSPRGTLTSTLRKTEAVKSPTKTTTSTITSRVSTNGVAKSTTTTRTSTTKTTSSTVPATTATRTTTSSLSSTGTKVGATTPTNSKTNSNLVPRKSTPLKKTITNSSTTPTARKSIGSKLNSPATKPTKDTSTPRPVTIPAHHQNLNSIAAEESKNAALLLAAAVEEPKLNGDASPDDVLLPPLEAAPVAADAAAAHPLIEMDTV